ncbi:MAG: hypothetical protein KJN93_00035, partial [Alphaproteobacteria bacterium]|nr:hypothetical protein [Alphaproteobacteria bacterium]
MITRLSAAAMIFAASFFFSTHFVPTGSAAAADFAKATYRGKPAKCPSGTHFSLRKGGECWACPKRMKRTILPITGKWACERPAYTTWR